MANKVLFGLEQVHIAFLDNMAAEQPAWSTPVHIPGAVNFAANPDGSENTFYADNTKYWIHESNNGYTGELEIALFPDEVIAEMLGWEIDTNGMLVEKADAAGKPFALMGQVKGDARNRRFVYYNCKASRPGDSANTTTDSITPTTQSVTLTMLPVGSDKLVKSTIELDETNQAIYEAFFEQVTLPNAEPPAAG